MYVQTEHQNKPVMIDVIQQTARKNGRFIL